jgi:hypothetical protein
MRDRHRFDIEHYTNNLAFAILLSSLLIRGTVLDDKIQWQITTETERTLFNSKKINEDIDRLSDEIATSK